jgi:two-component system, chemotaxis family, chemotaxis protein CheY
MDATLLVVDDSMIIRELIKDAATSLGWTIVGEAANGQDAIDAFVRLRPDAVTMDVVMPRFDGLHGLRGIRGFDPAARVVIASAIDQNEVSDEARRIGAFGFLLKPFNQDRLITTLRALMDDVSAAKDTQLATAGSANLQPIRKPSGSGTVCGALGAKCSGPPLRGRFSDRP